MKEKISMSTKQEDAALILKLYDLRREETMRKARNWFFSEFNPTSLQDIINAMMGEQSAYLRMVTTYWDMAASFVNHGAIDEQMFNDANAEHVSIFAKMEPFLAEIREKVGAPKILWQLEQLVRRLPDAETRTAAIRERFKQMAAMRASASGGAQAKA
jgi:hypothetical protein